MHDVGAVLKREPENRRKNLKLFTFPNNTCSLRKLRRILLLNGEKEGVEKQNWKKEKKKNIKIFLNYVYTREKTSF